MPIAASQKKKITFYIHTSSPFGGEIEVVDRMLRRIKSEYRSQALKINVAENGKLENKEET